MKLDCPRVATFVVLLYFQVSLGETLYTCDHTYCYARISLPEDAYFCARYVVPVQPGHRLQYLWSSRTEVELASRLHGEQCGKETFFAPELADVDYVTAAMKVLAAGLKDETRLNVKQVKNTTIECLRRSAAAHVSMGRKTSEADGSITVTLSLAGCEESRQSVRVMLHSSDRVEMSGFYRAGGVELSYEPEIFGS